MNTIQYKGEHLHLNLGSYTYGDNLYVGVETENGESYCDLTINIPTYMFEDDNEIIINGDVEEDFIEILESLGILFDTYKYAFSGFGKYRVMIFNESMAKEYVKEDLRNAYPNDDREMNY